MRCKNCNKRLSDDATFCPRCGENVRNEEVSHYKSDKTENPTPPMRDNSVDFNSVISPEPIQKPKATEWEQPADDFTATQPSQPNENYNEGTFAQSEESASPFAQNDYENKTTGYTPINENKQPTAFPQFPNKRQGKNGKISIVMVIMLIVVMSKIIQVVVKIGNYTNNNQEIINNTVSTSETPVTEQAPKAPNPADYFDCEPTIYNKHTEYGSNGYYQTFFFELDENYPEPYIAFLELLESDYDFELNYTFDDDSETMKEGIQHHYIYYTGAQKVGKVAIAIHEERSANIIIDIYRKNSFNYVMFTFYYGEGIELESAKEKSPYKVKISELYR